MDSDITLEFGERGVTRIRVFADDPTERERAFRLLRSVGGEIRALEAALRRERRNEQAQLQRYLIEGAHNHVKQAR